jgi:hypothetical protein
MAASNNTWWLKLSCFLIGWDYRIVKDCSELTKRDAKRYISAIILISLIWFFVGYSFGSHYLSLNGWLSVLSGLIAIVAVVQIERQIITSDKTTLLFISRIALALIMAGIGAVMIDQYMFKQDIAMKLEESRKSIVEARVESLNTELDHKLNRLRANQLKIDQEIQQQQDRFNNEMYGKGKSTGLKGYGGVAKGQESYLKTFATQRQEIGKEISKVYNEKLQTRINAHDEIMGKPSGLLEEFSVMISLITSNLSTGVIYIVFFSFFLIIELMIVITKYGNKRKNDYENIIDFQLEVRFGQLQMMEVENAKKIGREGSIVRSSLLTSKNV